ncbi:protein PHYTOCHROME KINASE SUBSTRATE 1-like [Cucurbita moschata]|uniref:Protein PHYTOCHROME KINASE SUBSTRATE 1-like n=1 Tax=Cucurbita moschata TaxID=3662 RepID=A0A6J1GCF6_CUCMO|nr:protein PHYTOCHROME KINASE SUBSTRATE 1-like [Cucurbita moschata]
MSTSTPPKPLPFDSHGEIGVFRAEKYFNGGLDIHVDSPRTNPPNNKPSINLAPDEPFTPNPWLATPSVASESCTTTTTTTQKPLLNTHKTHNTKGFLSHALGYYCMCYSRSDKPSDDIGEISFSRPVTTAPTASFRDNSFTFQNGSLKLVHFQEPEVERKSLEVFGSPVIGRHRNKPFSLEKKLAMLSWDHTNNNNYNNDEANSDCSSDLFEIESLTKQTNPFQSPTPSYYAPSEASVEWSVVTASALDFDERRISTTSPARVAAPPPPPPRRVGVNEQVAVVVQKRRSGSLLGCKSEKAVRVAEDNSNGRKISGKVNFNSSSSSVSVSVPVPVSVSVNRFEDETRVRSFSFRSQAPPPLLPSSRHSLATRSLPRPYSPRLSNIAFNIHDIIG